MLSNVVWFEESDQDVTLVGGKGRALAELQSLGLDVPEGYVVSTNAYRAAVAEPLGAEIAALMTPLRDNVDIDDDTLDAVSEQVRDLVFARTAIFAAEDSIRQAYTQLAERMGIADPPVAVRSSSAAEDSAEQSFAGEHDSYLWVIGADAVVEAVRRCWASLFTSRAISYRLRASTGAEAEDAMAVVVQRMVDARSAGVFMTLNPSNGDRSKVVIESVWGLGEPLVSGSVTPDRFVIDKITREILERVPANKATKATRNPTSGVGVSEVQVDEADRHELSLTDDEILTLVDAARRIEKNANWPQDGEFAIESGRAYLVQARPETVWAKAPPVRVTSGSADPLSHVLGVLAAPRASDDSAS